MRYGHIFGAMVAVVAVVSLSAVALAESDPATFDLDGQIGFLGLSQNPAIPTEVRSDFTIGPFGMPETITIETDNEMLTGVLGELQNCAGEDCEDIAEVFNGAQLTSFHNSTVELTVTDIGFRSYLLPTVIGDIPLFTTVISGDIAGQLVGNVRIPTSDGSLYGTTNMAIQGTADYACFSPYLSRFGVPDAIPGLLQPCLNGQGNFLPIGLDVVDKGQITIQQQLIAGEDGPELLDSDVSLAGEVVVAVESQTDIGLLVRGDAGAISVTGGLQMTNATGEGDDD